MASCLPPPFPARRSLAAILLSTALLPVAAKGDDEGVAFFESRIRPVLVERCYSCHAGDDGKIKGGLRLDSREASRKGGDSGPAVVPGKVDESLLMAAIRYDGLEMPPDGRLSAKTVADFEQWIESGAPDPRTADPRKGSALQTATAATDWDAARRFWSFQPPQRHRPPAASSSWPVRPSDTFILAAQQRQQLQPNPPADRRTLIRRVTFDLTGLPPTPEEVDAFLQDDSPLAYEQLVERLLASPSYGERWARPWLDLARYAEDQAHIVGNDRSLCYPNAWRYRDWVIEAFNRDLSYDDFIRQQLAADLINPDDRDSHVALGFLGLGPKYYRRNAPEVMADEWEDRVDIVGRGLLGLTVACARCHDHKYDPIPTADYYALAGVFASTEMFNRPVGDQVETEKNGQAKNPEQAIHILRDSEPKDLPIHIRGNPQNVGPVVPRAFLTVLSPEKPQPLSHHSGRLDLAEAIASRANPLTARVIVNRVWGELFGRPLASTTSNFGKLGELPSHPELLDDLAVRFMDAGWSLKWLQRELVLSAAYRQSSEVDLARQQRDADNRWLWRMNRRRLSVEGWRDAVLVAADRLSGSLGGPSLDPQDPESRRRTVYSRVSRLELDKVLALFDFPDPNVHSERRQETITPLQKLFALNSPFMLRQAEALGELIVEASQDDSSRLDVAYRRVFLREPTAAERLASQEFLASCGELDDKHRWTQFAQALLAANEMLVID